MICKHCPVDYEQVWLFHDPLWWRDNSLRDPNEWAVALFDAFILGEVADLDRFRLLVMDAWWGADSPLEVLTPELWVEMFESAGYVTDCAGCPRPESPPRLWRGGGPDAATPLVWTDDFDQARHDALRFAPEGRGVVEATSPRTEAVLASFQHAENRGPVWLVNPWRVDFIEVVWRESPPTPR